MPSSITHGYFATDVYNKLKSKKNIDINRLKTFSQGPDILFFYHSFNINKAKDIRKLGKKVQRINTQLFFYNLIKYIVENNLENNTDVINFLYGFILHYSLDSTVHPYVFYKTGVYNKRKKETLKYKNKHDEMEKYLDNYMINKNEKIKPSKFKIHKYIFDLKRFDEKLNKAIDYTFINTFNVDKVSKYYYISLRIMNLSYYLLRYDPYSIKKHIYKAINKLFPFLKINVEVLSYAKEYINKEDYLNNEHKTWNHPCIIEEKYNHSFDDLYHIAINKAIYLIEETNKILYDNKNIEYIKEIFTNLSYVTGKDCNLKLYNKYFEK